MTSTCQCSGRHWAEIDAAYIAGIATGWVLTSYAGNLGNILLDPDPKLFWFVSRASGITALVLLTISMALGLAISTRLFDQSMPRALTFGIHEHTSWLALALTGLHAGVLLLDRAEPFSLAQVLLPFTSAYRPVPVGLGVLALYGMAAVTISFYLKPRLSHHAWRLLHLTSYGLYLIAVGHGILSGSDTGQAWMQWLYLTSAAVVLFLTLMRILLPARQGRLAAASTERG